MEKNFEKRFKTKDGRIRISIYRDDYASNPRDMTNEPLHCYDWSRDYSIMSGQDERMSRKDSARSLLMYMLVNYGDYKKIIDTLIKGENGLDNRLEYDRSAREWVVKEYSKWFGEKEFAWKNATCFECKKVELSDYMYEILDDLFESTIDYLVEHCMTDKVKMMRYGFGYYGNISFYDDVTCDSEGIAWLEKDEFLKYSGCKEDYWNGKSLDDIEWLIDELRAWGDNDVYGFITEECIKSKIHKEYTNVDKEDEDYEEEEWENTDSCGGFYGDLDKCTEWIVEQAGFKMEELEEVEE